MFLLLAVLPEARVHPKITKNSRHPNKRFFLITRTFLHLALSYLSAYVSPKPPAGSSLHLSELSHMPLPMLCLYIQDLPSLPLPKWLALSTLPV